MNRSSILTFLVLFFILLSMGSEFVYAESSITDREDEILNGFAEVKKSYEGFKEEIANLIPVDFELDRALLLKDEKAELRINVRSETLPNPKLELIEGCYLENPRKLTFDLEWMKSEDGRYTVTWKWTPTETGNYLLHWDCDIGGDIPEFFRSFSVIDETFAVAILNSTSHREPRPEPDFHDLHLPFSYWAESLLLSPRGSAEQFTNLSRGARQFGDDPGLMIFKGGCYLKDDQTVFYDEPESVQRAVLQCYKELWEMHGFPEPLSNLYTYGMGNGPATVARSLGYDLLGALCADQNWGDGPFKINHWGMPARPYFVSPEDFRKPGPGGSGTMVGVQQCARYTVGCRDYNCVYSFEGGISYAFDQYTGQAKEKVNDEIILSREKDFLECLLNSAGQSETPFFFSCGFEMNGVWPDMAAVNRMMMEHLVERSREVPLAFASASEAAKFMRHHHNRTPESVLYLTDVYSGLTQGGKPALYPDTMEIENHEFRALFRFGETLPYAQYDYTTPWDYPDWANRSIPRKADGYVIPNTEDRFQVTPKILDTRGLKVSVETVDTEDTTTVELEIEANSPITNLTLSVWNLPRVFSNDSKNTRVEGANRFIPIRAPYTGNFCGIVIVDIKEGKNRIRLTVTGDRSEPRSLDLTIGKKIMAKVLEREGQSTLYLFTASEDVEEFQVSIPTDATVQIYPSNYDPPIRLVGETRIQVKPGSNQRIVGLGYQKFLEACSEAKSLKLWDVASVPSLFTKE